jgi:CubicO group peptidase (beta-lactamase class C family)
MTTRREFLRQLTTAGTAAGLVSTLSMHALARESYAPGSLPASTPEAQGVSSAGILAFLLAWEQSASALRSEPHSFTMLRHGHVIAKGWWGPYRRDTVHLLYSLSKSFTSTAVGFAVAEGKLRLEDRVTTFFPAELPSIVSDDLAALQIKHLLTMSVGHVVDSTPSITKENDWAKAFLALPIGHTPGSVFLYDSGASYMLSAIVQRVSGERVIDYLQPRLFAPLESRGMIWETCPRGINTGGWGLSVGTETLAKFGQLYLQKGRWKNRQLLPEEWIGEATTFKIQQPEIPYGEFGPDWQQGYGYQFWRCRHNAFRGDGAFGQFCVVVPDLDAVIAITSESGDLPGVLNLVWDHLLPSLHDAALQPDPGSAAQLKRVLSSRSLALPGGGTTSPTAHRITGKPFKLEPNNLLADEAVFRFHNNLCVFELRQRSSTSELRCGIRRWVDNLSHVTSVIPRLDALRGAAAEQSVKIAAAGAWKRDDAFEMLWHFYETPHSDTVTCQFDGEHVRIEFVSSIVKLFARRDDNGVISPPEPTVVLKGRLSS